MRMYKVSSLREPLKYRVWLSHKKTGFNFASDRCANVKKTIFFLWLGRLNTLCTEIVESVLCIYRKK